MVHEGDEPKLVVDLLDADPLTRKDLAQIDLAGVEADTATSGDDHAFVVEVKS
jgi:hypothetical protein